MKKKLQNWFHKLIIIPRYEKRLMQKNNELTELKESLKFIQADRNKYRRKYRELTKLLHKKENE